MSSHNSLSLATESPNRRSPRRRRGERACDFCRLRKLRCDQARPQCQNCGSRSLNCEYSARPRKPRPSNARIEQLREQNEALQAQLSGQQSSLGSGQSRTTGIHTSLDDTASSANQPDPQTDTEATARQTLSSTQEADTLSDGGRTYSPADQFHGPTSAIADTTLQSNRTRRSSVAIPDIYQKARLTAETAKQRHLEQINVRQGMFAFGRNTAQQGMALLTLFWNRQHATGSIVYRPSFMRDMATGGKYFSPLLLQAMLLYALRCSPGIVGFDSLHESSHAASLSFRHEFNRLLYGDGGRTAYKSDITTIQALLLMSDVLFAWLDERSIAWHYLGIATTMIIDLGMHTERSSILPEGLAELEQLEIRRRVFWAAFILDKIQAIYQGRPARLRDIDCSVPALFLDEFEELEPFKTDGYSLTPDDTGSPAYSVSHLAHLCSLNVIADRILYEMYTEKTRRSGGACVVAAAQSLQGQLDGWRESLPAHLSIHFDASRRPYVKNGCEALPHVLSLLSMFHALTILLHRPFIPDGHLVQTNESVSIASLNTCNTAGLAIDALLRWYKSRFCVNTPPYFITYAAYASATIHVRIASQQRKDGETHYEPLLTCLEVLSDQSRRNRATCRMREILLELVEKLNVNIGGKVTGDGYWERDSYMPAGVGSGAVVSMGGSHAQAGFDGADFSMTSPSGFNGSELDPSAWSLMPEEFLGMDLLFGFQAPDLDLGSGFSGL